MRTRTQCSLAETNTRNPALGEACCEVNSEPAADACLVCRRGLKGSLLTSSSPNSLPTQVRGTSQGVPAARQRVLGKFPGRRGRECQPETATGPEWNALGEDGRPFCLHRRGGCSEPADRPSPLRPSKVMPPERRFPEPLEHNGDYSLWPLLFPLIPSTHAPHPRAPQPFPTRREGLGARGVS